LLRGAQKVSSLLQVCGNKSFVIWNFVKSFEFLFNHSLFLDIYSKI